MDKLKSVMRQVEFHLILFVTSVILLVQPLSVAATRREPHAALWRLLVSWTVVIVLLFLVSRAYRARQQGEETPGQPGVAGDAEWDGDEGRGE